MEESLKSLTIIIPYYSVATMERSDKSGIVSTANSLARIIFSAFWELPKKALLK